MSVSCFGAEQTQGVEGTSSNRDLQNVSVLVVISQGRKLAWGLRGLRTEKEVFLTFIKGTDGTGRKMVSLSCSLLNESPGTLMLWNYCPLPEHHNWCYWWTGSGHVL